MKGLELLEDRPTTGSISAADQFSSDELERFWLNAKNIQKLTITGCEPFPGEMLKPSSKAIMAESMLELMVAFYNASYIEMYKFRKLADEIIQDSITIRVKINQFGRCRIGSEVFGSAMEVDSYPGQIQYFFKHTVDLPNGQMEHNLAYICWYRPASTSESRYYFHIDDEDESCNVELWKSEFYDESRDLERDDKKSELTLKFSELEFQEQALALRKRELILREKEAKIYEMELSLAEKEHVLNSTK
ncbi:hypothetical protein RhiirC2_856195 [Rhizophagus irregularis]|uniref:Uncharacterized protein n=1 Tax=Rhizophagus irregularis TaxID=588596 RepID=A0A2N1MIT2_9GLOM|nr:hypothetical protein RhiirC2_856195 [Rhizophagus irregularis]